MIRYFDKLYKEGRASFCEKMQSWLAEEQKTFIVTANPETVMRSEKDEELHQLLVDDRSVLVPDGIGIVKAAGMLKRPVQERITGIDLAEQLMVYGNEQKKTACLFGAKPEVIEALCGVLKEKYPDLSVVGAFHGYEADKDAVMEKIVALKPDIVLVALGIPLQEKLIYRYLDRFEKGIFIGVGGSFDVMSGFKKRAPKFFIKLNLEWLYRILKEPQRLKRFWDSNVKFIFKVKKYGKSLSE